jgi:predicted phosphate transport protein (TIGR00153 family)
LIVHSRRQSYLPVAMGASLTYFPALLGHEHLGRGTVFLQIGGLVGHLMLNWFQELLPREDRFFAQFNSHAEIVLQGAEALCEVLKGGPGVADAANRVMALEVQADMIARDVLLLVRRTFVTPFDRGDIKDLISTLDDTIDQMQKTAKAVLLFEVRSLEPQMAEMGDQILTAARLTVRAVGLLGTIRANSTTLNQITEDIIRLEDESDTLNDKGIKALFKRHRDGNAMDYIVGIEIYDHLEKVMDRFEDVANRISGIVIEHA